MKTKIFLSLILLIITIIHVFGQTGPLLAQVSAIPSFQRLPDFNSDVTKSATSTDTLLFDQQGRLRGNLPQKLLFTDMLAFNVSGKNLFSEEQKQLIEHARKALKHIQEVEADSSLMNILNDVYKIKKTDLDNLAAVYKTIADNSQVVSAYIPLIRKDTEYYQVKTFDTKGMNQIEMQANKITPFKNNCTPWFQDQNDLNISLTRVNLFRKVTLDWLNTNAKYFANPITATQLKTLKDLENQIPVISKEVRAFVKTAPSSQSTDLVAIKKFSADAATLKNKVKILATNIQVAVDLSADKDWLLNWFWYQNNSMPSLNPFPFVQNKDITADSSHLAALRVKISYYQSLIKTAGTTPSITVNSVNGYVAKIDSCNNALQNQMKEFQDAQLAQTQNQKLIDSFATTGSVLNKVILSVSTGSEKFPIFWMRHHNAANQGEEMTYKPQREYSQEDRIVILTHNLQHNQQASIQLTYQAVAVDESELGDILNSSLSALSGVSPLGIGGNNTPAQILLNAQRTTSNANLQKLTDEYKLLMQLDVAVQYVIKQQNPPTFITEIIDSTSVYHTQKELTPTVLDSQQASYTVTVNQTTASTSVIAAAANTPAPKSTATPGLTVTTTTSTASTTTQAPSGNPIMSTNSAASSNNTFHYRVNKLYRIYPMAGFAFTLNNFVSVNPNTTGTGPGLPESAPQTHYIGGLKIFFKKTDIRNTSFIGDVDEHGDPLFWTRVHFDLAVDLDAPLNNIYTGFGLDPVPGAAFNFGVVWNRYTYYEYSGGQQTINKPLYRPGIYIGLTTDAAVVAQIIKLFK